MAACVMMFPLQVEATMAEQYSGATQYRYFALALMLGAFAVGILQAFGVKF